jgi:hypothetical protein
MTMIGRLAFACVVPMLLTGCLLVPGKFVSDLTIHADRSFAFSYKGQVIASDPSENMSSDAPLKPDATAEEKAEAAAKAKEKAAKAKEREEKNRAIAAALAREWGYRSVVYKGNGLFEVDYAVNGMLTTNFTYPFNTDAEVMIPFVAIETRKDGTVRVRAPGFGMAPGQGGPASAMPTMNDPSDRAEGVFTLTTDAEIVAQNQEEGAKTVGPNKVLVWTIGKIKKDAPTAVLRMND